MTVYGVWNQKRLFIIIARHKQKIIEASRIKLLNIIILDDCNNGHSHPPNAPPPHHNK
jgi:hypothetical protein